MYTLETSTELMKSHKAALTLSDQSGFQVLQNTLGFSLFFGIGDTKILYLSVEQTNAATGWSPIDLTTELMERFPNETVTAKSFAVSQDPGTGNISIAQVVHIKDRSSDVLFVLTGLSNQPNAGWLQSPSGRPWIARPYDDMKHIEDVVVLAYVELLTDGANAALTPQVIAGVQDPSSELIQDYIVNLTATTGAWTQFPTPENLDNLNDMVTGQPQGAPYPGVYQLYTLNDIVSLTFTPWRGLFGPPDVIKLTAPTGASSLATVPTGTAGGTDLYVAATGAIYLFPAAHQTNDPQDSQGIKIISDPMIANVDYLRAHVAGSQLSLWGKTNAGVVFYSRCALGSQSDPTAWSAPIPIATRMDQLATMLDLTTQRSVLFGHTDGLEIVKLTQDPTTTQWRSQPILLPPLSLDDVFEFYTYTTRIEALDDNRLPIHNQAFALTSSSPCSVYIDNVYVKLSPTIPLQLTADMQGTLTIVQQTRSLGAVCYNLVQGDGSTLSVNPMSIPLGRMGNVQTGADLQVQQIPDEHGNTTSLVPAGVPPSNVDAVAHGIHQFVQASATLPQNGSLQPGADTVRLMRFDVTQGTVWGMTFNNGVITYAAGPQQMAGLGFPLTLAVGAASEHENAIEAFAGDIFRWLESLIDEVKRFFVQVIDGVAHFFIEIGQAIYHFVMQCIDDVVHGIQFVLDAIKVTWDRIVQWVGFIFNWDDILRTHASLKNIFKQYAAYAVAEMATYQADITTSFDNLEKLIDQWAGLPPMTGSVGESSRTGPRPPGSSSPQAHYGTTQAKGNASGIVSDYSPSISSDSRLVDLLSTLETFLTSEETNVSEAFGRLKTEIIDNITTLSLTELLKKLIGILFGDLLLPVLKTAAVTLVEALAILVEGVMDVLDAPLDIPVLSWLYKSITKGSELTALDFACLIAAIPTTIIFKMVTAQAPFPDNNFTRALVAANDFDAIRTLYRSQSSPSVKERDQPVALALQSSEAKNLIFAGGVTAFAGAAGVIEFGIFKSIGPALVGVYIGYAVSYLLYVAPDIFSQVVEGTTGTWDVNLNTAMTGLGTVKTFVDISLSNDKAAPSGQALKFWRKLSPIVEIVINGLWEIPVIGSIVNDHHAPSTIVGCVGNSCFNIGGVFSGVGALLEEPPAPLMVTEMVLAGAYSLLSLVQVTMNWYGD